MHYLSLHPNSQQYTDTTDFLSYAFGGEVFPGSDEGACVGKNTDIFYPLSPGGTEADAVWDAARAICAKCDPYVKKECLRHALLWPEKHGMWAGTTPDERRRITRSKAAMRKALS